MVNLSTPTLQIKTSGFNLSDIKEANISITYPDGVIKKGNADIEIDNDVMIVFLKQEEANRLKGTGANISISAIDQSNIDSSDQIKIIWVKRGSRSSSIVDGSFVNEEIFNQTISNINDNIEGLENGLSIGGNRVYLDYQDGKYGINTDPHRGADTFSPFKPMTDASEGVIFIDSKYDAPSNGFSTMTQMGVYNGKIIEKNPFWSEIIIMDKRVFSTEFEKINIEVEEG